MTFLPIVERELRVLARRSSTAWIRFYVALGIVLLWLVLLSGSRNAGPAQLGQSLFLAFGVVALGFCLLAGVFLTADCLSEEKREGTLGLLFLTDLRGYDVVLGKLMATSVQAVYGLMAIFPVLALPLLMGGVTIGEFWRVVLVLLITLCLSLCIGLLVSAFNREARHAMAGTLLVMLMLAGVLPTCWWLLTIISRGWVSGWILLPSPTQTFRAAFDSCYCLLSGRHEFWLSVLVLACLTLGCLGAAAFIVPRIWHESQPLVPSSARGSESAEYAQDQARAHAIRAQSLEPNPFRWLAGRNRSSSRLADVVLFLLFLLWFCFLLASLLSAKYKEAFIVCMFTSYALHIIVKYFVALEATRQLNEDRRSGALELLLVTPLREGQIIAGHSQALGQRFITHRLLLVFINLSLAGCVVLGGGPLHMNTTDAAIFLELFLGGLAMFFLDFKAIQTLGLWIGLRSSRHGRATLVTLLRIMGVPWLAVLLMVFMRMNSVGSAGGVAAIFALWFVAGIVTDVVALGQAMEGLRRGFRSCLAEGGAGAAQSLPP